MSKLIRRYSICGSRRLSNLLWTIILFFGSIGFLFTGFASLRSSAPQFVFYPQGLVMVFYGFLGFFLSIYLGFTLLWGLGSGFNEFNKKNSYVRIFRWGFPGKNRRMNLYYPWGRCFGNSCSIPTRTIYTSNKYTREKRNTFNKYW